MKVGDLVRVYDFSHEARQRLSPTRDLEINAHTVGLIVATGLKREPWVSFKVLRCVDGEQEDYNVNRLEVIA